MVCPAEEARESEAFLRESETYAEHLGAALPRLLPERAAQRGSIVELAPETADASLLWPDEQAQAEHSSVKETSQAVPAMESCESGTGGLEHSGVLNISPADLKEEEPQQAADANACITPVSETESAARTPLVPLAQAGSNTQATARRTPRKASKHRSTFTFDRQQG